MNERPDPDIQTHPTVTLLPWYLAGTLSPEERRQVIEHLETCQTCRQELDEMKRLRDSVKAGVNGLPGPPPDSFRRVMAQIQEQPQPGPWAARADAWLRALFAVQWAPTLAALLVIGQSAALLWLVGHRPTGPAGSTQETVIERSVPTGSARLSVRFQETATEREIRAVMQSLNARMVDGPSPDGLYILQVSAVDAAALEKLLEALRAHRAVIEATSRTVP
jgi:hypothetical protein